MRATPFLSKSKYLAGLQCRKLLWHHYNAKDELPETDAATQAIFDQGHLVGDYAKRLFPNGIEVAAGIVDHQEAVDETAKRIGKREPLFEAAFRYKNAFARADILNPVGSDTWDVVEVKSATRVKDVNLSDLSLQKYVISGAGLKVGRCYLMVINNRYVREGEIEPGRLFTMEDVSEEVNERLPGIEDRLDSMVQTIAMESFPEIPIGLHCGDPYACPLQNKCFAFLPEHHLLTLHHYSRAKAFEWIHRGVHHITDLQDRLSASQEIQVACVRDGEVHINKPALTAFLNRLTYPVYYLDFETMMPAIPLFDGTFPYQQIPFQFSLHRQVAPGARPEHFGYLAVGMEDPRPEFLRLLKSQIGNDGSIVTYNEPFERRTLDQACGQYREYLPWNAELHKRMIDLYSPFRSFHYYHPSQRGSTSLKTVYPAVTGKGYENMEISDGGMASREYYRVTYGLGNVSEEDRLNVRRALEAYCHLDTLAMVEIVDRLRQLTT